ncbi:outer membrane protein TolC [Chitinophaga dinghuensis]|uniref:Outer membrane protein TolC n=2 Tax=Chitinophaga dinghuensis TaxID=1539050 RepID=A0A327VWI9_9BACT|nr:outer membrane protein TolC [Chitinophaga dinghuensis]
MELCSFIVTSMSTFSNKMLAGVLLIALSGSMKAFSQDPEQQNTLTLTEVWKRTAAYNKQLQMQQLKVESADERVKTAKSEKLPEVSANGMYGRFSNFALFEDGLLKAPTQIPIEKKGTYKVSGEAYFNLYNGGKLNREITAATTESELATEQKHLTESEIRFKAAAYYLDIYRNEQYESVMLQDIAEREKELEEIRHLLQNGVVLKSDVLRAELKLSKQKMTLLEIRNSLKIATQRLNIMMGTPDTAIIHVAADSLDQVSQQRTYEDFLQDAYTHSFEFKISEKETKLSELKLQQVKANILPKVGLFAEYNYSFPQILMYPYSFNPYGLGMAGVKASLPISQLYLNKHRKAEAKINLMRQEIEHSDTQDRVREDVRSAYLRYTEAITRIQVAKENIAQAQENFRIVNNTYFNQLSLLTDLLDAETQLLQSRFDLTTAQVTAQLQYYQLLKATGNL